MDRNGHANGFVFIHINKTGGSSIETALDLPFQHRTALQKRAEIGPSQWRKRFTFSIVRNPWDRVVSHYAYRIQTDHGGLRRSGIGFREWVTRAYGARDPRVRDNEKMFMPQTAWLTDRRGRSMVDFVGRFERLEEDFELVCGRIGRRAELPHVKASERDDYRSYYDKLTRSIVENVFRKDIRAYGYRFESREAVMDAALVG